MKVSLERLPESRVQLDIEVDQDRLERSLDAAYRRIAQRSKIPGFRPGKAPRQVVERMYGREGLIREALDRLVPDAYNEAIESEDVDAIDQPDLEIVELEPVRFKATVPVRPTVNLNDYQSIRVEKDPVEVTDEMVEEQIMLLRRRHATHAPVERGAQWADILTADVKGSTDDQPFVEDEAAEFALREGQELLLPGLAEAFLDMKKGDEKTLELEIPEDFRVESLRGKTATFELKVTEVKEEQLPDEDDEFANMVNAEEFPTFEALKERITNDLREALEEQAEQKFRSEAVDRLVQVATIDYPRVLVDREIDHLVQESTGNDRQGYLAYLQSVGRTEAEFREQFREAAELRVRRSLALSQLAEDEKIEATPEDVEAELERLSAPLGDDAANFRNIFQTDEGQSHLRRNLVSQKTLDRLAEIASGEPLPGAPAASEPESKTEEPASDDAAADAQEEPA
ncbi:MAG: trigger factor [Dehalococcoidia bacterium]|nr:trigger factor [Dehalococcoidia bacterium]